MKKTKEKNTKKLTKRTIAFASTGLIVLLFSIAMFWFSYANYDQTIEPAARPSWDPNEYGTDSGYTPTGLMYETKDFHLGNPVQEGSFPAGAKQYLVKRSETEYSEFDKAFLYCVQGHEPNTQIYLGSQAFFEKYWSVDDMPNDFPKDVGDKERRKFNFLMNVYGSYMGRNDSITACNDANSGTANYIIASVINWIAADDCGFTGNWKDDLDTFKGKADYKAVLKQMNPNSVGDRSVYNQMASTNIPEEYKAKGCANWAEYTFRKVWDAATITKKLHVDTDKTVYYAKTDHVTDTYTVTVPYPDEAVKEYYQRLSAKDLYGDWTYSGPTDAGLVFSSASGEVPTDGGSIAVLYPSQAEDALAKDLGSAQLATFKFYTMNASKPDDGYGFDKSQTYFVAKMDKDLEIHIQPGANSSQVKRLNHTERFVATYNAGLNLFDSETGKPIANAKFKALGKFDDSQLNDTDLDIDSPGSYSSNLGSLNGASWEEDTGSDEERIATNYNGDTGLNTSESTLYNQGNDQGSQFKRWSDPEQSPSSSTVLITNDNGTLCYGDSNGKITSKEAIQDAKGYTYLKGYCTGHPAPVIEYQEVPEPEYDEETGDQTNGDEIEKVEQLNQELHDTSWGEWLAGVQECERLVEKGGFFHAIDPTGKTQIEALEKDRDEFIKQFIALKYDYSLKETTAASAYSLHGAHPDDIPIEWRTVTSAEYKDYQMNGLKHTGGKNNE